MKRLSLLLATVPLLASFTPLTPVNPDTNYYEYQNEIEMVYIEPLRPTGYTSKMFIKYSLEKAAPSTLKIYAVNDVYMAGKEIISFERNTKAVSIVYDYKQTHSNLNMHKNMFMFRMYSEFGNDQVNVNIKDYQYHKETISEENQTVTSPQTLSFYTYHGGVQYISESWIFKNCKKEYYLDNYTPIDIMPFSLSYEGGDRSFFHFDRVTLFIKDTTGAFSDLGQSIPSLNYQVIELKDVSPVRLNTKVFESETPMYVNPKTLKMSSTKEEGYIQTNKIYFPLTCKDGDSFTFRYSFRGLGGNETWIEYLFPVTIGKPQVGNCLDSLYCIRTNEAEPNINNGTRISH